jgi:uncharacterized protein (TIGR02217 family)
MSFLESRMDENIERGSTGGPTVPGRIKTYLPNGQLLQNFSATAALHKYDISYGLKTKAYYQSVLDLWYVVMMTPYEGFRFKDWRDFEATQANSKLTLITGATYQLQRKYTFGGATVLRDIYKPVLTTVLIWRTRSSVVTLATATVDYTTGIATISGHTSGDTYTWTGEFDVPVTFVDDDWHGSLEVNAYNPYVQPDSVKLEELLLT